ncbi:BREX-1 system phosphatase PglZ type A, partial [Verrucomicrobia bacterium]|nr:BREX-1 system phosphatase PglZ type A [Verrucomicrobiota bacterium]
GDKARSATQVKQVSVQVLGTNHMITTSMHRFQLLQMEAVSERVKPITLKVAVYDGENAVTPIETVTFDSRSSSMDDRKKWISLVLKDQEYDGQKPYRLVLREAETSIEKSSIDIKIKRAFSDDF